MLKKVSIAFVLMSTLAHASNNPAIHEDDVHEVSYFKGDTRAEKIHNLFSPSAISDEDKEKHFFSIDLEKVLGLDQKVNHIFLSDSERHFPFLKELALEFVEPETDPKLNTNERFEAHRSRLLQETGYAAFRKLLVEPQNITDQELISLANKFHGSEVSFSEDFPIILKAYLNAQQGLLLPKKDKNDLLSLPIGVANIIFSKLDYAAFSTAVNADVYNYFLMHPSARNQFVAQSKKAFPNYFQQVLKNNYYDLQRRPGIMIPSLISELVDDCALIKKGKGRRIRDYLVRYDPQTYQFGEFDSLDQLIASMFSLAALETSLANALSDHPDDQGEACNIM